MYNKLYALFVGVEDGGCFLIDLIMMFVPRSALKSAKRT